MPLTHAQQTGLEAAILAYLAAAEGGRFARTVAAFKEESQLAVGDGSDQGNLVVSGAVLEKAWAHVYDKLTGVNADVDTALYDAIKAGDLAEVQLYACVGVEVEIMEGVLPGGEDEEDTEWEASPLYWATHFNHLEIVRFYVESGHDMEFGGRYGEPPLMVAADKGHLEVVRGHRLGPI